jgi:hypothetical protein
LVITGSLERTCGILDEGKINIVEVATDGPDSEAASLGAAYCKEVRERAAACSIGSIGHWECWFPFNFFRTAKGTSSTTNESKQGLFLEEMGVGPMEGGKELVVEGGKVEVAKRGRLEIERVL